MTRRLKQRVPKQPAVGEISVHLQTVLQSSALFLGHRNRIAHKQLAETGQMKVSPHT